MKKIMGTNKQSQSSPFPSQLGWIGCAIQQTNHNRLPVFFFSLLYYNYYLIKKKIIPQNTFARAFSRFIPDGIGSVYQMCFRDVTMGKIQLRPRQWWAESAPPGGDRVKLSQNLGATWVAPVACLFSYLWAVEGQLFLFSLHKQSPSFYLLC